MTPTPIRHKTTHHAVFHEIDGYGHLSTLHYVYYFVTHRSAAMRERFGLGLKEIGDIPVAFYVKNLSVAFIRPVIGDRPFSIESHIAERDERGAKVLCEMLDENGKKVSTCTLDVVCVDKKTARPCPWPEELIGRFYE